MHVLYVWYVYVSVCFIVCICLYIYTVCVCVCVCVCVSDCMQKAVCETVESVQAELEEERRRYQGLLREFTRLEQRYDNLRDMSLLTEVNSA